MAGEDWLSWLWIDTKDAAVAAEAVKRAKAAGAASRRLLAWLGLGTARAHMSKSAPPAAGTPIRNGAMGYNLPTFIRVAVRSPEKQNILLRALTF